MPHNLRPAELEALKVVGYLGAERGVSPSLAEVAGALHVSYTTARKRVERLQDASYLTRTPGRYKSIHVTRSPSGVYLVRDTRELARILEGAGISVIPLKDGHLG